MTTRNAPKYQTDYTYSVQCTSCAACTTLGSQHGQFWKPGDTYIYTCVDCGDTIRSPIFRRRKS